MGLQLLQEVVRRQRGVAMVEPDDHPDRQHVVAHRIDERAAELAVLGLRAQRPTHRVDDAVERLGDLPHLLHAEFPHLRVGAAQIEVVDRDVGEMTLRALGEHGHVRDDVVARFEVAERFAADAAALVAGAHADDARRRTRAGAAPPSRAAPSRRLLPPRSASQRPSCDIETMTLP